MVRAAERHMNNSANTGTTAPSPLLRPDSLERLLSPLRRPTSAKKSPFAIRRTDMFLRKIPIIQNLANIVSRNLMRLSQGWRQDLRPLACNRGIMWLCRCQIFSETPIIVLALMRANLVPCLLPLSWSISEISLSFQRLNPRALISCGQIEDLNPSVMMRELAFSNLHIRFVMGVGYNIADGVSDIGALFDLQPASSPARPQALARQSGLKRYGAGDLYRPLNAGAP